MNKPIEQFKMNLIEVLKLNDTYKYINKLLTDGIDINGLLRAQIVFIVSALDQYIHQVIVYEMKEIFIQNKQIPASFSKLLVGADVLNLIINGNPVDKIELIENDIRLKLGWKSFQNPEKINEGLKMVFEKEIWKTVSAMMSNNPTDVKQRLSLIVKRRDCIAHEADYDPVNLSQYDIDESITNEAVNFIVTLVFMLDSILFDYTFNPQLLMKYIV